MVDWMAVAVEVIIVSFNSGLSLTRCCAALLREPFISRIHVVDNTRDGADALLLSSATLNHGRVAVTISGRNRGFGPAVNSVLGEVESRYVAVVNPDGVVESGAIDRLVRTVENTPNTALAGARLLGPDGHEQRGSRRREPTPARLLMNTIARGLRLRRWYGRGFEMSDAPLPPGPTVVDAVSGACMVARTDALRAIGGFDERFFLHFEDLDLCKRLRDAVGKVVFVPDAVFHHEGGGSSTSRPYFVIWHKHLSMAKYYWKHYRRIGHGGLWLTLIVLAAMLRCGVLMGRQAVSSLLRARK